MADFGRSASIVRRPSAEEEAMHFTVGFRFKGQSDRITIDAEDALIAALKVKVERPEALITYVRHQNKRGDTRHPSHSLKQGA
jgi:hypothetical protein